MIASPCIRSFDLTLEALPRHQIRDIIVIVIIAILLVPARTCRGALLLLHALIALGEFPQARETVGTQLVENTGDELRQLFVFAVAVDGEGVGGDSGVD